MSDLVATNCGCQQERTGCGNNSIIWILLLLCFCGNNTGGSGLFNMGTGGCGCGDNNCMWIILLLLFCNGGCGC